MEFVSEDEQQQDKTISVFLDMLYYNRHVNKSQYIQ